MARTTIHDELLRTDVVIVGSGAASMAAAIALADGKRTCTIVTADRLGAGSSERAQGGLAAALGPNDSTDAHVHDTVLAGAGLCEPQAVRQLAIEAPLAIAQLLSLGARFDLDDAGQLDLGLEGGHAVRRIVHRGAATGVEVCRALSEAITTSPRARYIQILEHTQVRAVSTDDHGDVCGVVIVTDRGLQTIGARAVVLATGGAGALWAATTNPPHATGSGISLALRAGAVIRDLEFQQWHPTSMAITGVDTLPLISEAVRGEGATIIDASGRVIADPLATRDVVSAAIAHHAGADGSGAFLDGTHLSADVWSRRFSSIRDDCRAHGIDPLTVPIPIRPATHSTCGGVVVNLDGRSCVNGLFVVGEAASTGVHGANRLASNGLTEALITGTRAGRALLGELPCHRATGAIEVPPQAPPQSRRRMAGAMASYAGPLRDAEGLHTLRTILLEEPASDERLLSLIIAQAAAMRDESRGTHRRVDAPESTPRWLAHTQWHLVDGEPVCSQVEVTGDRVAQAAS